MKTIKELKKMLLDEDKTEIGIDRVAGYGDTKYLGDTINDIADGAVDVYTYDLMNWLKDHVDDFEDYINEYGVDGEFRLNSAIRDVQFIKYSDDLYANLKNLILYYLYHNFYNDDEILSDKMIELIDECADDFERDQILPDEQEFNQALNEKKGMI